MTGFNFKAPTPSPMFVLPNKLNQSGKPLSQGQALKTEPKPSTVIKVPAMMMAAVAPVAVPHLSVAPAPAAVVPTKFEAPKAIAAAATLKAFAAATTMKAEISKQERMKRTRKGNTRNVLGQLEATEIKKPKPTQAKPMTVRRPRDHPCVHGVSRRGYYCRWCPGKGICEHGRRRNRCPDCKGIPQPKQKPGRKRGPKPKQKPDTLYVPALAKPIVNTTTTQPTKKLKTEQKQTKADVVYPMKQTTPQLLKQENKQGPVKAGMQKLKRKQSNEENIIYNMNGVCVHGRSRNGYYCKECPGKGICEHSLRRNRCKHCRGTPSMCEHGRRRSSCKECICVTGLISLMGATVYN